MTAITKSSLSRAIIVCALGYFIDVFDIQLFAILRVPSLTELGVPPEKISAISGNILNAQMAGMILGAFLWGWLGDRFGRIKALYGSILIYSLGTLACSWVHDPVTYGFLRFITGFGLAGEVGAAVVLIAEMMPAEKRGWGVTLVGGIGFLGPVAAVLTSFFMGWRETYIVAGLLGFLLLLLRMKLVEPEMFQKIRHDESPHDFVRLFLQRKQIAAFLLCLILALPLAYTWNLLNFFSMEFGRAVLEPGAVFNQKICLLFFFVGTSCGDVLSGIMTQMWRSRRKAMLAMYMLGAAISAYLLLAGPAIKMPPLMLYAVYFVLGIASGCWALATMITAEHFGTNIRATASLVMLNFLRGFIIPMLLTYQWLIQSIRITDAAMVIGFSLYTCAFIALLKLSETHGIDLDYVETLEKKA